MKKENAPIKFALRNIKTNEFAIIEEAYKDKKTIKLGTTLNFAVYPEDKQVGLLVKTQFNQGDKSFLIVSATCHFEVDEDGWNKLIDEKKGIITLPMGFASHLAVITVGTLRGILHEKVNRTKFNNLFIPTINLSRMITEDVVIELEDNFLE